VRPEDDPRATESVDPVHVDPEQSEQTSARPATETTSEPDETRAGLFAADERQDAERRWNEIQTRFVDEPRASVEAANALVAELVDRLVSSFDAERSRLEGQWDRGEDVTTEDLRLVLQRYRSFFSRLLGL
jgi:hypothetical protein